MSSTPLQDSLTHSVILDGEMMVWDPALEKYLAFGSLKTAALGEYIPVPPLLTTQIN